MSVDLQSTLKAIWRDVLSVSAVASDDNFFNLGGDSILSMVLLMKVEEDCGVILDPGVLFEYPEFAGFCRHIALVAGQDSLAVDG